MRFAKLRDTKSSEIDLGIAVLDLSVRRLFCHNGKGSIGAYCAHKDRRRIDVERTFERLVK